MRIQILGILNVTPDSFSDGSPLRMDAARAIERGLALHADGADIVDVGGESTRPGFTPIGAEEELRRVIPVIRGLAKASPTLRISIDTRKAEVAKEAIGAGASIVNAYQGLDDSEMEAVVCATGCPVVAYHTEDVRSLSALGALEAVRAFFARQERIARNIGLPHGSLICDPGIGFGKTFEQNITLVRRIRDLADGGRRPILIGVSRKSHLGTLLRRQLSLPETPGSDDRLEAGLAEAAHAVASGATYVRTHDVRATRRFLAIWTHFTREGEE